MRKSILAACCLFLSFASFGRTGLNNEKIATGDTRQKLSKEQPLYFLENKGQITDQNYKRRTDIQYQVSAADGLNIFVGDGALHYQFSKCEKARSEQKSPALPAPGKPEQMDVTYTMYRMDVTLVGANKAARVVSERQRDYYERFYTGDANGAVANAYEQITYKDVYPNIDWVLYTREGKLKHEFVVRAGGNISDIKLKYGGASSLKTDKEGNLTAVTPLGQVIENAPYCYERNGKVIASHFKVENNTVTYELAPHAGEVVIDPSLSWVVYMGPTMADVSKKDQFNKVATDAAGNVFVSGTTTSSYGIATSGAYSTTYGGGYRDAMLVKYNSAGTVIWSTYYGGSGAEAGGGVAVDVSGNVYMSGSTSSSTGIATPGAYQTTNIGSSDAFIVKFTNAGVRIWGTYYGGNYDDDALGLSLDGLGNVFICGNTRSTSGLASAGAHQTAHGGGTNTDAFVAKFSTAGTFYWCTYYGSPASDDGCAVASDNTGNVYLTGYTSSTSAISTSGSLQPVAAGSGDAYLVKFNGSGVRQWGTYYGGTSIEYGYGVATDAAGNVYITGATSSTGMATAGAYQTVTAGGYDNYIAKFDATGSRIWGTYYGGNGSELAFDIALDATGNIYVTGMTTSTTGIATADAYQAYWSPGLYTYYYDAFMAKFTNSGMRSWGTYYGVGTYYEQAYGIAADATGNVYVAGVKGNVVIPYDVPGYGDDNAMLIKFRQLASFTGPATICAGTTATYTHDTLGGTWTSSNTSVATIVSTTGVLTGVAYGTTMVSYTLPSGTVVRIISVDSTLAANPITGSPTLCVGGSGMWLSCATPGGTWIGSDPSVATIYPTGGVMGVAPGTVTVTYTASNTCGAVTVTKILTVNPALTAGTISGTGTLCVGGTTTLSSTVPGGTWNTPVFWVASVDTAGVVTGLGAGTAITSYTITNSCGTAVATTIVTVTASTSSITGPSSVCSPATITLSGTPGGGTWSSSAPGIASVSAAGLVTGGTAGTAMINYSVPGGCGTAVSIVTVNPAPNAGTITGTAIVCMPGTTTLSTTGTTGGMWISTSTGVATITSGGVVSGGVTGTSLISYTVTNGCGSSTTTTVVTVNVLPTAAAVSGPGVVCAGSTITASATVPGGTWSSNNTLIATVSGGVITGVSGGAATISYTMSNSCGIAAALLFVTVNPLPVASISGPTTMCVPSSTTLTSTPGGTWSSSASGFVSVGSTGVATAIAAGTAIITHIVSNSCGTAVGTHTITVQMPGAAGTISGPAALCVGSGGTFTTTGSGGVWSIGPAALATVSGGVVWASLPGSTMVSYTVSNACGTSAATATLTIDNPPVAGTLSGPSSVCAGSTIPLTATGTGGTWSSSTPAIATVSTSGVVSGAAAGAAAISYIVTNTCGSASTTHTVMVDPLPVAGTISGNTSLCPGATLTLSCTGTGGTWSSGSGSATVSGVGVVTGISAGSAPISYTVTNGCGTASAVYMITVLPISTCTAGIDPMGSDEVFSIYPNPSDGTFTVSLPENHENGIVSVTDVLGRVVASVQVDAKEMLIPIILQQPTGNYVVKAVVGDRVYYGKVTVVR